MYMKHWDSISCEFDEHSMDYKSSMKLLFNEISIDHEFLFYILRVNNISTREKMQKFYINEKKFLEILKTILKLKNYQGGFNYSVLKDPVSDKLPEDYETIVQKEKLPHYVNRE